MYMHPYVAEQVRAARESDLRRAAALPHRARPEATRRRTRPVRSVTLRRPWASRPRSATA
jgi:hypothetical protein